MVHAVRHGVLKNDTKGIGLTIPAQGIHGVRTFIIDSVPMPVEETLDVQKLQVRIGLRMDSSVVFI